MNVVFFNSHPLFQRHFATDLELAQEHISAQDHVTILRCEAELLACEVNNYHEPGQCALCQKTQRVGTNLLEGTFEQHSFYRMTADNVRELQTLKTEFASLQEIEAYTIENFDIGMAAMSSIISYVMDSQLDIAAHKDVIRRYITSSFVVYRSLQNFFRERSAEGKPIDRMYIFNGRMSNVRAALRACEQAGVEYFVHEAAAGNNTYSLFPNSLPHDIGLMTRLFQEQWHNAGSTEETKQQRQIVAEEWFTRRAQGLKVNGYSFVENQERGLLPPNWDVRKKNVIIFNSADFEFIMVGAEYKHHIYRDQLEGIRRIIESLLPYKDTHHVYLRIHPNLATVENELVPLLQLRYDNLTTIPPNDKISSYALMEHADKIVVFGSTVGIEAPFWGKPSILAGRAVYQELGATYNPVSHDEVMTLLLDEALPPKDRLGALQYGYFYNSFGIPFKHYESENFFRGTFRGKAPFADRWLFRAFTLYKRTVPKTLQERINTQFVKRTLHRLHKKAR